MKYLFTEMGEYLVGAYLKLIAKCDIVDYNVRPPEDGLLGLAEFDVMGFNFGEKTCYLCEVVTHILGMQYGDYQTSLKRLADKVERATHYAKTHLPQLAPRFQIWSPVVPSGLAKQLDQMRLELMRQNDIALELVVNQEYAHRMDELWRLSSEITHDTGNPAFRLMQILSHLRRTIPADSTNGLSDNLGISASR